MLRSPLRVVVTRVLPYLCRTISGNRGPLSLSQTLSSSDSSSSSAGESSSSDTEEGQESLSQGQVLRAYLRNRRARCVARVREQGLVPAVLIDGDKERRPKNGSTDVFLSLDAKPLVGLLKLVGKRDFVSRVFDMNIYRSTQSSDIQESLQVLPRNLNYGPGKTNILNVQLVRATPGQTLKLGVPLEYLGAEQCPGLKKGGTLKKLAKYVVYNCKATEVPAKIVVDMTVLEIGDRVQVQDLEVDFDLLYSERTMPICEIVKDVSTLKAKAKRLKNEVYFKKKALAEKESRSSLSDDEVDVSFREDEHISTRFQRHIGVMKELPIMNSISRVSSSIKKGKRSVQRLSSLSDDEVDVSDDEVEEVSTRFRRPRDDRTELPFKNSISSRAVGSMKKGKLSKRKLRSLSDDEIDVNDAMDEERHRDARKELPAKNSISRVSGSVKRGKVFEPTLSDDEGKINDDGYEERQGGCRKDLTVKNSISRVSGSIKKGKASKRRLHGTPFKANKTLE